MCSTNTGERTDDWRKLGSREFENFFGESAKDVKKEIVGTGGSKFDLYEDKCTGEIFALRKGGVWAESVSRSRPGIGSRNERATVGGSSPNCRGDTLGV